MTADPTPEPTRLPTPPQVCAACGRPARMALGLSRGVTALNPHGQPRAVGYMHEAVYFDYRAAPTIAGVRFYCKADGVRMLGQLADIFVSADTEEPLDPDGEPDDPNARILRLVRSDGSQP